MKPASFELHRPGHLDDALALLAAHVDTAKIIAGGQSLVPLMNLRMATPSVVIDLGRLSDLRAIRLTDDALVLGAMVRQAELLEDPHIAAFAPLLRAAAAHIGHVQTRARGTIGGSVAHADPAAELPTTFVALDAGFTVRSLRGSRTIPARQFFEAALTTALADDEILCEIIVPKASPAARVSFREIARRHGDFAIVSVAVHFDARGHGKTIAAVIGGVLAAPFFCTTLESAVAAGGFDATRIEAIVAQELASLDPVTDLHASGAYRAHLAGVLLTDCLNEVLA